MGPTTTTTATAEWPASAWRLLVRRDVTWREALHGSVFLASSVAGAGIVLLANAVRRSRRRPAR